MCSPAGSKLVGRETRVWLLLPNWVTERRTDRHARYKGCAPVDEAEPQHSGASVNNCTQHEGAEQGKYAISCRSWPLYVQVL